MAEPDGQSSRVTKYYQKTAQNYDREYDTLYWKELYDKITWRYIEPYLPTDGLVLDAGGGTGKWSIPIAEKGLQVIVYDISKEMLDIALKKAKEVKLEKSIITREGDICNIDFPDDHFDFVLAEGDPISYCDNPDKAVEELSRVLKSDCFISAGVDSLFSLVRRLLNTEQDLEGAIKLLREKRFYSEDLGFHFWAFTPKDLKDLFQKHNLKVVKIVGKTVAYSREIEPLLHDSEKAKRIFGYRVKSLRE
jgi:ubiquinone/menaquinone biosynthesis C-methylase UbiE